MVDKASILARFNSVRLHTYAICAPLRIEDHVVQPESDVSPPRWHLGHTSWFFEQFVLSRFLADYQPCHPKYAFLFNSYYNLIGERTDRPRRGLLSRPTVEEVWAYRREVDARVAHLVEDCDDPDLLRLLELGIQHEQQHQELLFADIKNILFQEPLFPEYLPPSDLTAGKGRRHEGWTQFDGGVVDIGHEGQGFAYDSEGPRHKHLLRPFRLANDLVSNAEYLEFIQSGGYTRPELWLSDGWDIVRQRGWQAPLYWLEHSRDWQTFTLYGLRDLVAEEPATHVSFYEADAFARWANKRLPTEFEWEHAAVFTDALKHRGTQAEDWNLHPTLGWDTHAKVSRMFGEVWEWTSSAYLPYPGYHIPEGAIGEYNGKFMVNQMVLRGASVATPKGHSRPTYRNFWHPDKRWQFTGIRLAEDA